MAKPSIMHWQVALKVVKYLKQSPDKGLLLSAHSPLQLQIFSDADWATCPMTRRSLSGYCVLLVNSLISWKCTKQNIVARSSAESEYRSMAYAVCEATWLYNLLKELHFSMPTPLPLYCDNTSAISIVENLVLHERKKHIELDVHLVREKVKAGFVQPLYLSTIDQPADLLTKALTASRASYLLSKLGAVNIFHPPNLRGGIRSTHSSQHSQHKDTSINT